MAEAPAITLRHTRDISAARSEEIIPTLVNIGEDVRNRVLPLTEGIVQEVQFSRSSYIISSDRGNIRLNIPVDRQDVNGELFLYYPTRIGKGKGEHDARVRVTIGNGYEFADVSDRESKRPIPYKPSKEELMWLSTALQSGDPQPAQSNVKLSHEVEEVDAP